MEFECKGLDDLVERKGLDDLEAAVAQGDNVGDNVTVEVLFWHCSNDVPPWDFVKNPVIPQSAQKRQ
jgi:hypothetical protein